MLCSCGKQTTQSFPANHVKAQLGQAKHFDIPIPLSYKLAQSSTGKNQQLNSYSDFMRYTGSLSVEQTITFFKREMEQAGWEIIDLSSTNQNGFLYCSKPSKQCGIQIQSSGKPQRDASTDLCLFVSQKT